MWCNYKHSDKAEEARRGREVLHWVEGERVDGPDVVDVVDGLAMTFKGVFLLLGFGARIKIFHGYPSFH